VSGVAGEETEAELILSCRLTGGVCKEREADKEALVVVGEVRRCKPEDEDDEEDEDEVVDGERERGTNPEDTVGDSDSKLPWT
jgi:hypothetical protein